MDDEKAQWKYDNLPAGTSWIDAPQMGILPTDAPYIASGKVALHEQEQQRLRAQAQRQQAAASARPVPAHDKLAAAAGRLDFLRNGKIMSTAGLASHIEYQRRQLEFSREQATRGTRKQMRVAGGVFIVCLVVILLGLKLPGIPYKFMTAEYLAFRCLALAALLWFLRGKAVLKRAFSAEEKELRSWASCTIDALKKNYQFETETARDSFDQRFLLGRFKAPDLALTTEFLNDLSARLLQATGKPLSFQVYRFKEVFGKRLFLDLHGEDRLQWEYVERVTL